MSFAPRTAAMEKGSTEIPHHYDKIFIGAGLASLFAAYSTLKKAEEAGRDYDVLVIGEEISSPCKAGSHYVLELEGMMADDVPNREEISEMLRHDGRDRLLKAIEEEGIDCRLAEGYEIKCKTEEELQEFFVEAADKEVFARDEMTINTDDQIFKLPGYPHSLAVSSIGQVNTPELLDGMVDAIERMGGTVLTGIKYKSHMVLDKGYSVVHTNGGEFNASSLPFMGTGAIHQSTMSDFKFKTSIAYTGALVIGPIAPEDSITFARGPMAICDVNLDDDVLWGGIDSKGMLTIGKGDLPSADLKDTAIRDLTNLANDFFPGLIDKYPVNVAFGPMMIAENKMPIVGRLPTCDVAAAWSGLGIVAAMASGEAFAQNYIYGDDSKLKIWEAMQPQDFKAVSLPTNLRYDL